jgi:hypothetical protein
MLSILGMYSLVTLNTSMILASSRNFYQVLRHIYTYIHVYIHICICTDTYGYTYINIYICTDIYVNYLMCILIPCIRSNLYILFFYQYNKKLDAVTAEKRRFVDLLCTEIRSPLQHVVRKYVHIYIDLHIYTCMRMDVYINKYAYINVFVCAYMYLQ